MSGVKLPLLTRKNIRDEFDNKKDDLQKPLKELLGEEYTFDVDWQGLFAQADEGYQRDQMGKIAYEAIDDLLYRLKSVTNDGQNKMVIENFNSIVSKRSITVKMDEKCPGLRCGCRVTDGVYEIVFLPHGFGTNLSDCNEKLVKALDAAIASAKPTALPLSAKMSIKKGWEDKKAELEKNLSEALGGNPVTCHADYDDIWTKIVNAHEALPSSGKNDIDLESCARNFGNFLYAYFDSLLYQTKSFNKDDMIIESFLDEVAEKQAWFQIIKDGELKGLYYDTVIENGKLYTRTVAKRFGVNTDSSFQDIVKLL